MKTAALLFVTGLFAAGLARAASTDTLPEGVRSVQLRHGRIQGLDQVYSSDGKLYLLGEKKSITFDAATLAQVSPEAATLVRALNGFGTQQLGSAIQLGTLRVDTHPEVQYIAPVIAYGLTDKWTLGIGLPMVNYRNRIQLRQENSNLAFYRAQFSGIAREIDEALNIDLVQKARETLAARGYKSIEDRQESHPGDAQVALLRGFDVNHRTKGLYQLALTLPTGPAYDPDDLLALNSFGRTAVENSIAYGITVHPRFTLLPYASLLVPVPDRVTMRVPMDENDSLPDASRRQDVGRWLGPTLTAGGEVEMSVTRSLTLKAGYEYLTKARDSYDGTGRTDLLSDKTNQNAQRVKAQAKLSSVDAFRQGEFAAPGMITAEISDTIAGLNIERQLKAELSLMLFF